MRVPKSLALAVLAVSAATFAAVPGALAAEPARASTFDLQRMHESMPADMQRLHDQVMTGTAAGGMQQMMTGPASGVMQRMMSPRPAAPTR